MTTLDLGSAPEVRSFHGRAEAVAVLSEHLLDVDRRLVVIHGLGGGGKTCLALGAILQPGNKGGLARTLRAELVPRFRHVVWRSLLNSPSLPDLLRQLIASMPEGDGPSAEPEADGEASIERLVAKLRRTPTLLVLDNAESLLDPEAGPDSPEYAADYAALFSAIAGAEGGSCLVLTTREITPFLDELCDPAGAGLVYRVPRLEGEGCRRILERHGIRCPEEAVPAVVATYGDSPLLLELVAKRGAAVHRGDIAAILAEAPSGFGRVTEILDWHLARLTVTEHAVATSLAIARVPLAPAELERDLRPDRPTDVSGALFSLRNKMPVEHHSGGFTLHPVLIERFTDDVVERVADEIVGGKADVLERHPLLHAVAADPVREAQQRLILKRILARADARRTSERAVRTALGDLIAELRRIGSTGFAVGNVLNLLCASGEDIVGLDLGRLTLRNAFLRDTKLIRCDLTGATMSDCAYAASIGIVLSVAVSPDGREIVAGDIKGSVQAWRLKDGHEVRAYPGHADWVRAIAFSRDGSTMATASSDYDIRIWDRISGRCTQILKGHAEQAYSVDFHPDGNLLASGAEDRSVILWDPANGGRLGGFEVGGRVRSVRFNRTGDLLVVAAEQVSTWRVRDTAPVASFTPAGGHARRAVFSPDGSKVAVIDARQVVRVLDAETLEMLGSPFGSDGANWVEFSPDGSHLAAGCQDGTVRRWGATGGLERLPTFPAHDASIRSIAFATSDLVVTGGEDRCVKLLDVRSGTVVRTIRGSANGIRGLAWGKVTNELAVACEDGRVEVWSEADGTLTHEHTFRGHVGAVEAVAFDPRGVSVASAADDGTIRIWERSTGQATVFDAHSGWVWCLAFDAAGGLLATGGKDRRVTLWDVGTRRMVRSFEGHVDEVHAAVFIAPDTLVSGGDDSTIRFWDTGTGEMKACVKAHGNCVRSLAYDPSTRMLASGSDDGTVKLWSRSGDPLGTLEGHDARVRSVVFGAEGRRLFSAGDDATVCMWDVADGRCVGRLRGHSRGIWSISINPVGTMLAAGGMDGSISVWNLPDGTPTRYWPERPYEGSRIAGVQGMSPGEVATWIAFGAQQTHDDRGGATNGGPPASGADAASSRVANNSNPKAMWPAAELVPTEDPWVTMLELLVDLYPSGPDDSNVWERAGGDMSRVQTGQTGREAWHSALNMLKRGGGGNSINPSSLCAAILEDYPNNDEILQVQERVSLAGRS